MPALVRLEFVIVRFVNRFSIWRDRRNTNYLDQDGWQFIVGLAGRFYVLPVDALQLLVAGADLLVKQVGEQVGILTSYPEVEFFGLVFDSLLVNRTEVKNGDALDTLQ